MFDTANASLSVLLTVIAGLFSQASRKPEPRTRAAVARPAAQAEPAAAETAPPRPAPAGETLALTSLSCGLRRASVLARFHDADATGFMRLAESVMAPLIQDLAAHGAWINRFDGTSFSAQWPAAENDAHADAACDAAGRLILAIATANEGLAQQWPQGNGPGGSPIPALEIGIGLATGACLVGAIRAGSHIGLCAVAESGVTAERMGLISERYGSAAIASDTVCAAVQRAHAFLEADFLVLDPGSAPVRLYALLGNALVRANPKFRAVATFHEHIFHSIRTRQWEKARALIAQCRKISGANPKLYDLHLSRIAWYEANPPPPDWDGAFRQPLR